MPPCSTAVLNGSATSIPLWFQQGLNKPTRIKINRLQFDQYPHWTVHNNRLYHLRLACRSLRVLIFDRIVVILNPAHIKTRPTPAKGFLFLITIDENLILLYS